MPPAKASSKRLLFRHRPTQDVKEGELGRDSITVPQGSKRTIPLAYLKLTPEIFILIVWCEHHVAYPQPPSSPPSNPLSQAQIGIR